VGVGVCDPTNYEPPTGAFFYGYPFTQGRAPVLGYIAPMGHSGGVGSGGGDIDAGL